MFVVDHSPNPASLVETDGRMPEVIAVVPAGRVPCCRVPHDHGACGHQSAHELGLIFRRVGNFKGPMSFGPDQSGPVFITEIDQCPEDVQRDREVSTTFEGFHSERFAIDMHVEAKPLFAAATGQDGARRRVVQHHILPQDLTAHRDDRRA